VVEDKEKMLMKFVVVCSWKLTFSFRLHLFAALRASQLLKAVKNLCEFYRFFALKDLKTVAI
jgi:hypothetical protein